MKNKVLPLVLVLAVIVSVFFIFRLYSDKQSLTSALEQLSNEKESLIEENSTLKRKISDYKAQNDNLSARLQEVNRMLNDLQAERNNLEAQVNSLQIRNADFQKEITELRKQISMPVKETPKTKSTSHVSVTNDRYWQDVLQERAELKIKIEDLNKKFEDVLLKISKLKADKEKLALELNGLKKEKGDLQSKLEFAQRTIDLITKQLVREKERSKKIMQEFDSLHSDNIALRQKVNLLTADKEELLAKLKEAEDKRSMLEDKVRRIEVVLKDKSLALEALQDQISSAISSAKANVSSAQKTVELPPIVVNSEQKSSSAATASVSGGVQKTVKGKIIAVNEKDKFVIVDLGKNAGIDAGDSVKLMQDGKVIASLPVIEARKDISACDTTKVSGEVKEGDTVVFSR